MRLNKQYNVDRKSLRRIHFFYIGTDLANIPGPGQGFVDATHLQHCYRYTMCYTDEGTDEGIPLTNE